MAYTGNTGPRHSPGRGTPPAERGHLAEVAVLAVLAVVAVLAEVAGLPVPPRAAKAGALASAARQATAGRGRAVRAVPEVPELRGPAAKGPALLHSECDGAPSPSRGASSSGGQ